MLNRKLKALLIERHGTCIGAAEQAGINPSTLSKILNGHRRPSERDLAALERILHKREISAALGAEPRME